MSTSRQSSLALKAKLRSHAQDIVRLRLFNIKLAISDEAEIPDKGIEFLVRVMKRMLLKKQAIKSKSLLDTLQHEYDWNKTTVQHLREVMSLIPAGKSKNASTSSSVKSRYSRIFKLDTAHPEYDLSVYLLKYFRAQLKYCAVYYGTDYQRKDENAFAWVSAPIITQELFSLYNSVRCGDVTFDVDDVVSLWQKDFPCARPKLGRISKLIETLPDGVKQVQVKPFVFWNQVVESATSDRHLQLLQHRAKNTMGALYPPRACDVFLGADYQSERLPIVHILEKVNVVHEEKHNAPIVDGSTVFLCQWCINLSDASFESIHTCSSCKTYACCNFQDDPSISVICGECKRNWHVGCLRDMYHIELKAVARLLRYEEEYLCVDCFRNDLKAKRAQDK